MSIPGEASSANQPSGTCDEWLQREIKEGRLRGTLNIHRADVYHWTELDIAMADDMVDRTWAAVERARAGQAAHRARPQPVGV